VIAFRRNLAISISSLIVQHLIGLQTWIVGRPAWATSASCRRRLHPRRSRLGLMEAGLFPSLTGGYGARVARRVRAKFCQRRTLSPLNRRVGHTGRPASAKQRRDQLVRHLPTDIWRSAAARSHQAASTVGCHKYRRRGTQFLRALNGFWFRTHFAKGDDHARPLLRLDVNGRHCRCKRRLFVFHHTDVRSGSISFRHSADSVRLHG
jgi:hypothetical protein